MLSGVIDESIISHVKIVCCTLEWNFKTSGWIFVSTYCNYQNFLPSNCLPKVLRIVTKSVSLSKKDLSKPLIAYQ